MRKFCKILLNTKKSKNLPNLIFLNIISRHENHLKLQMRPALNLTPKASTNKNEEWKYRKMNRGAASHEKACIIFSSCYSRVHDCPLIKGNKINVKLEFLVNNIPVAHHMLQCSLLIRHRQGTPEHKSYTFTIAYASTTVYGHVVCRRLRKHQGRDVGEKFRT